MKYDVILSVKDIWALNPSDARIKAIETIKLGLQIGSIGISDFEVFCHQIGGEKKKI